MKNVLINVGIILGILFAYYIDFFGWFTGRKALLFSLGLVVIVFWVGVKILGNPFAGQGNDEDEKDGDE